MTLYSLVHVYFVFSFNDMLSFMTLYSLLDVYFVFSFDDMLSFMTLYCFLDVYFIVFLMISLRLCGCFVAMYFLFEEYEKISFY